MSAEGDNFHEAAENPSGGNRPGEADLVARVRAGDRQAMAEFFEINKSLVRRRVRQRLRHAVRRIFDSQEILSTVWRRLDELVRIGGVRAASPAQLVALMQQVAHHAVIDKGRVLDRLSRVEAPDAEFAVQLRKRLLSGESSEAGGGDAAIARVLESLDSQSDREIMSGWLRGIRLKDIAEEMHVHPDTLRQRWVRIRRSVEVTLSAGGEA